MADSAAKHETVMDVTAERLARVYAQALWAAALKQGRPGYAAVDVYEDEPVLGASHPLIKMPNALCTPHLGYVTQDGYENLYGTAIDSILGFVAGKPVNVLNPEALAK